MRCRLEVLLDIYEGAAREQTTNPLALIDTDPRPPGGALVGWRAPRFSSTGALAGWHPGKRSVPELKMRGV